MKKLILFFILFFGNNLSARTVIKEPVEFQLGIFCTLLGCIGIKWTSYVINKIRTYNDAKSKLKDEINKIGGKVHESSHYHREFYGAYNVGVTTKNCNLELPAYPTLNDLHVISINWNEYQKLLPQEFQLTEQFKASFGLTFFSFLLGGILLFNSVEFSSRY